MHSLSLQGKLSSLYSLLCVWSLSVCTIYQKRIREGKHFRMVTGRNGTVFFVFFFAMGRSNQACSKNDRRWRMAYGLENAY